MHRSKFCRKNFNKSVLCIQGNDMSQHTSICLCLEFQDTWHALLLHSCRNANINCMNCLSEGTLCFPHIGSTTRSLLLLMALLCTQYTSNCFGDNPWKSDSVNKIYPFSMRKVSIFRDRSEFLTGVGFRDLGSGDF